MTSRLRHWNTGSNRSTISDFYRRSYTDTNVTNVYWQMPIIRLAMWWMDHGVLCPYTAVSLPITSVLHLIWLLQTAPPAPSHTQTPHEKLQYVLTEHLHLMVQWLGRASQWYEMFGHDPEVTGLNPSRVKLGCACLSWTKLKIPIVNASICKPMHGYLRPQGTFLLYWKFLLPTVLVVRLGSNPGRVVLWSKSQLSQKDHHSHCHFYVKYKNRSITYAKSNHLKKTPIFPLHMGRLDSSKPDDVFTRIQSWTWLEHQ